jgi:signal transduction histidine kinase
MVFNHKSKILMNNKLKILIVDDKIENIIALEKLLGDFKVEFVRAFSGNEALVNTFLHDFALAIIDIQMPDMDGYETVELMRQEEGTKYLPIIFVSAIYKDDFYIIKGIESGAFDFISKPIVPEILKGKVKVFLDIYTQQKEIERMNAELKRDIRKRKKAEKALKQHAQQLQERNEELDAFSHTVAHDLKNPLGSIMGFAEFLFDDYSELSKKEILKYISIILNSSNKMHQIINSLLLLASVRTEEIQVEELDMQHIVKESLSRLAQMIEKSGAEIKLTDVWPIAVGYTPWIEEVWTNYLNNAIKYGGTPPHIEIGTDIGKSKKIPEGMARFWIQDNGPGISAENQKLLFKKFERLDQAKTEGHGLGLSIVRRIIEKLGGEVGVESEQGKGSLFYFTLPFISSTHETSNSPVRRSFSERGKPETCLSAVALAKEENLKPETREAKQARMGNPKILIAEDVESADKHLSFVIKKISNKILHAKTGKEAVDLCLKNPDINLILMDIKMPEVDGYEATRKIREFNKDVIIIAQTAYALAGDREKTIEAGCDDYISKPIKKDKLLEMIEKYLRNV